MSQWYGDFRYEEEFNDERGFANAFGRKILGYLGAFTDTDWFAVDLPRNSTINVRFEGMNYQPGTWNVSWFSPLMQSLSEQNIRLSSRDGVSSYEYSFNTGPIDGSYYYRIKPFSSGSFKSDLYFITTDSPIVSLPELSLRVYEISVEEGDSSNPVVPAVLELSSASTGSVVVHYTVRSGTATVGTSAEADVFGSVSGNITFQPGETHRSLESIYIRSDTATEANEYFWVDFDQIVVGEALFVGGANSLSLKINIPNDDFDRVPPVVTKFDPPNSTVDAPIDSTITVTFNESVQRGSGAIVLRTEAGVVVASFDASSSADISILDSKLVLNPSFNLRYDTKYQVEFSFGSVKDLSGNAYVGSATYGFSTTIQPGVFIAGTAGSDIFTSTVGADSFDGKDGDDTVVFSGPIGEYAIRISRASKSAVVTDGQAGRDGVDALQNVETVRFGGQDFALFRPALTVVPEYGKVAIFLFDAAYYLMSNPSLGLTLTLDSASRHYLAIGAAQELKPNPWLDHG